MKKFILLFCFIFLNLFLISANEYEIVGLGDHYLVLSNTSRWTPLGINDTGQIFGSIHNDRDVRNFFFDPESGFDLIELPDENSEMVPLRMNNKGQILFNYFFRFQDKVLVWDKQNGLNSWNSPIPVFSVLGFNDHGHLMSFNGFDTYCFWDQNGSIYDLGIKSRFEEKVKALGYSDYAITGITNEHAIIGYLFAEKYDSFFKSHVEIPFYWDGFFHIVPKELNDANIKDYNNKGELLLRKSTDKGVISYIWSKKEGLSELPMDFVGFRLNDLSEVFGAKKELEDTLYDIASIERSNYPVPFDESIMYCLWSKGHVKTLSELVGKPLGNLKNCTQENIYQQTLNENPRPISVVPPFTNCDFDFITKIIDFNSKGQILCLGYVQGYELPCIIQPIQEK